MAKAEGVSEKSVRRIWKRHGLKPHLLRTFKLSRDPNFAARLEEVVGLSLDPRSLMINMSSERISSTRRSHV
jgi:hypothetical protein